MIHAITGLIRQEFITMRRYWLGALSAIAFSYVLFVLLFFGVQAFAAPGAGLGPAVESLMVGYWVVLLTNMTFQSIESFVGMESTLGTLEQLYLSPFSFGWLALGKVLGTLLFYLAVNIPFLFLMMITTGRWLHIDVLSITPLVLLIMAQAFGLGFAEGGLILVYKRLGALSQAIAMLLVLFIAAPPGLSPLVNLLPFNLAWRLLRSVMADGTPLWQLPPGDLAFVAAQTVLLVAAGGLVYRGCERVARQRGLLSQY
ncbi:MAG: hypothetical protein M1546_27160 [Chloroflexi bacterium]|nr:hypothetical protein [Chloroflexota bacterium]